MSATLLPVGVLPANLLARRPVLVRVEIVMVVPVIYPRLHVMLNVDSGRPAFCTLILHGARRRGVLGVLIGGCGTASPSGPIATIVGVWYSSRLDDRRVAFVERNVTSGPRAVAVIGCFNSVDPNGITVGTDRARDYYTRIPQ